MPIATERAIRTRTLSRSMEGTKGISMRKLYIALVAESAET